VLLAQQSYLGSICVYHHAGTQFSPTQKSAILGILERPEFTSCYSEAIEGESTDGKPEIWAPIKINAFTGYTNPEFAEWIVKLFDHFATTVNLQCVT
jgi:hypothetical protein